MDMNLNNLKWHLKGYWPYVPMLGKSMELGNDLMGCTDWMDAAVPGGVHYDLLNAGLIEDPYFEQNSLKCEWVEHRWWMYKTHFIPDHAFEGRKLSLVFKGIDYKAHFFLNRHMLGEHEGSYEHVIFDVSGIVSFEQDNELIVLFEDAPKEMSQIGHTCMTKTQKSRFNYKWDFSTRMVNIGIWDDVLLKASGDAVIEDLHVYSDLDGDTGLIHICCSISIPEGDPFMVRNIVEFEGDVLYDFEEKQASNSTRAVFKKSIRIMQPELWYPNGIGAQRLYRVRTELYHNERLSNKKEVMTGIRKLEYSRNPGSPEDSLPYTVVVNGIPVYIKGVNLVPFDHMYGNVTRDTYDKYVFLLKKCNINLVRIWGGGIIEKDYFYSLCDQYGIMVWQEFIQSSSGINNVPSTDPHFLSLLKRTAVQAVKDRRNHVCHTVWSGGNELMDENGAPVGVEHPNIRMLKDIVNENDPAKLFLPTSASGPNEFLNLDQPSKNHDVHGQWKYMGIEEHYRIYNRSDSLLHSEFGVDGCSCIASLERFLSKENLKITDMNENLVWRHHGEWWDTLKRDTEFFGEFASLEQFVKASQFIQAEGIRYTVEANRRRKPHNSGSIVWQFNEPWPNVSCTCLADYYGIPKMAYYWLSAAYSTIHASLKYERLNIEPGKVFQGEIFIHNSLQESVYQVEWELLDINGAVISGHILSQHVGGNSAQKAGEISVSVPIMKKGIFFIRLKLYNTEGEECGSNLYVFSQLKQKIFSPLLALDKGMLKSVQMGQDVSGDLEYRVTNTGEEVCLFIHGTAASGIGSIWIPGNYFTLFPGEEKKVCIRNINLQQEHPESAIIRWDYLNHF